MGDGVGQRRRGPLDLARVAGFGPGRLGPGAVRRSQRRGPQDDETQKGTGQRHGRSKPEPAPEGKGRRSKGDSRQRQFARDNRDITIGDNADIHDIGDTIPGLRATVKTGMVTLRPTQGPTPRIRP